MDEISRFENNFNSCTALIFLMSLPNKGKARTLGVLLHPSALPSSPVCGNFGEAARSWLYKLAENQIGVWQFLPLAPTDRTGSPYSSPSSFALNPCFLDANDLVSEGFIDSCAINQLPGFDEVKNSVVNLSLAENRSYVLGKVLREYWDKQDESRHFAFISWCQQQFWLEDHVAFMELRRQYKGRPWWEWEKNLSLHRSISLAKWRKKYKLNLLEHRLLQWHLHRQWDSLRSLAKDLGILLFGDMPFYVSRDSADVWSKRGLFSISPNGDMEIQSGVPPDYFSSTGQLWGTPVYSWPVHQFTRFRWWRSRFANQWNQVDLLRLDHFRALESFWAVPGNQKTAESGEWKKSPGNELLGLLRQDCGCNALPLVAEDLGIITPEVEELRDSFMLSGMKVLQFAFDGNPQNPYLPENIKGKNWVVYTGTHDNPTTLEWWNSIDDQIRERVLERSDHQIYAPSWKLLEMGLASEANLVIAPLQDLLCLDAEARFNQPGVIGNNWIWRMESFDQPLDNALKGYCSRGNLWGRDLAGASGLLEISSIR